MPWLKSATLPGIPATTQPLTTLPAKHLMNMGGMETGNKEDFILHLKNEWKVGMIRSSRLVDRVLKSQGFITSQHRYPPIYVIWMEDAATGSMYRLRIPTDLIDEAEEASEPRLRLGSPSIERPGRSQRGPSRYIPRSIIHAASHKLAEVTSYLQTDQSSSSQK